MCSHFLRASRKSQASLSIFISRIVGSKGIASIARVCLNAAMTPDETIKHFGSQKEVARLCGVSPAAVSLWVQWGNIPRARQYQIHVLSAGRLQVDVFKDAPRKKASA